MPPADEFYIGYEATPPRLARRLRIVAAGLVVLAALVAALVVGAQQPFAPAVFEFGTERELAGWMDARPYPSLHVPRPGDPDAHSTWLVVAPGKHGFVPERDSLAAVVVRGTLIYRDGATMVETTREDVAEDPVPGPEPALPAPVELGAHTIDGEIVDSKCFLGVMNPGGTAVHRDCAVRCLSGGVPPLLVARDAAGREARYLLTTAGGARLPVASLEGRIARPVRVTGVVVRDGDWLQLRVGAIALLD